MGSSNDSGLSEEVAVLPDAFFTHTADTKPSSSSSSSTKLVSQGKPRPGAAYTEAYTAATAWYERRHFAAILSSHEAYPRRLLFDGIAALAQEHAYGPVDSPGGPFKNMDWPPHFENSHLSEGKLGFLRDYKFQITPENGRTWDRIPSTEGAEEAQPRMGGYNTEKIAHAFLAGVVPIYWGDTPIDEEVFNNKRIIVLDDAPGGKGLAGVLETMQQLLTNESFRVEWFAEPVLAPSASQWVTSWCERFGMMMDISLKNHGY